MCPRGELAGLEHSRDAEPGTRHGCHSTASFRSDSGDVDPGPVLTGSGALP